MNSDSTEASCHGYLVTKDAFDGTKGAGTNASHFTLYQHGATGNIHPGCQQESESWVCLHCLYHWNIALWYKWFSWFLFHLTLNRRAVKMFVLVLPQFLKCCMYRLCSLSITERTKRSSLLLSLWFFSISCKVLQFITAVPPLSQVKNCCANKLWHSFAWLTGISWINKCW